MTTRYTPPPSYCGVALTATTGIVATVTPGLAAQGGGLLAQAVEPCASIPRAPKGTAVSRRPHTARAVDLGRRLAAAIIERPVAPAMVMVQDPREHVARSGVAAYQLLDFAGVTAAAQTLLTLLDEAGIDWDVIGRRELALAVHGDATAGEATLSLHSAAMYGDLAAGGKGRAGRAIDLAVAAAASRGALDPEAWGLLSTAECPAFEGLDQVTVGVEVEPEEAEAPAPEAAPGAGDSTPAAQATDPAPEPAAPAPSKLRGLAAAIIKRGNLDRDEVEAWAGLLGPAPLIAAADAGGGQAGVIDSAARALGVAPGHGVLAAVMIAAADAGGEIEQRVRTALRPAPAA